MEQEGAPPNWERFILPVLDEVIARKTPKEITEWVEEFDLEDYMTMQGEEPTCGCFAGPDQVLMTTPFGAGPLQLATIPEKGIKPNNFDFFGSLAAEDLQLTKGDGKLIRELVKRLRARAAPMRRRGGG